VGVWPAGIEIISSEVTRQDIQRRGIPRVKHELVITPLQIAKLQADLAAATDPARQAELRESLRQLEAYQAELKNMQVTFPTITFDRTLILHQKTRLVEIMWLGRAHTDGDVVVYLPKEKFVATGDMLHGGVPYMADGYPYDWIETLTNLGKLDFDYAMGGHGEVMQGKATLELWKSYFRDLMAATAEAYAQRSTLDEVRKQVTAKILPQYENRFPPGRLVNDLPGNINKAYRVVSPDQN
jgi:glyoxylase-like metal-dependent hydrolase (beta-lactamase superfamily II)